jgi:hypothetical protein
VNFSGGYIGFQVFAAARAGDGHHALGQYSRQS